MTFSESRLERPDVGSSTKRMPGSRMSSRAMLRRLRWPPEIILLRGEPTWRSLRSYSPRSLRVLSTLALISSSERPLKQSLAL